MNINKVFFSSVIPSVLAFALSGIYAIVDGFFIGNSIGDIGLSTINVAYPVVALMQAIGTGIGMGGAVIYSISVAAGDKKGADTYAKGTGGFLLLASIAATAVMYIILEPVLKLLGAEGDILTFGVEYLRIIVLGAVFQVFSTGIVPLIRNYNGAAFAMASMIAGFLTNILLDYTFVWVMEWGVSGGGSSNGDWPGGYNAQWIGLPADKKDAGPWFKYSTGRQCFWPHCKGGPGAIWADADAQFISDPYEPLYDFLRG
ncbi:MAG: hypothetical protein K2O16_01295 [Lachnospiraceae bacterium]|nr:hypothetical protein [Lachnospiraceae bacterium]